MQDFPGEIGVKHEVQMAMKLCMLQKMEDLISWGSAQKGAPMVKIRQQRLVVVGGKYALKAKDSLGFSGKSSWNPGLIHAQNFLPPINPIWGWVKTYDQFEWDEQP